MRKAAALAMILAGALISATGEAQQPARRWEVRGFDFSPDGVWRRRARDVARRRGQAIARGDFAAVNRALTESKRSTDLFAAPARLSAVSQDAVAGTLRVPALLVRYKDTSPTQPAPSGYEQVLFAATGAPYSVRSLYEEMSNGLFSVQGTVQGWLTLDSNAQYYTGPANCNGIFCSTSHVGEFIREAVLKADPAIDYAQFDNDGPDNVPNSGDDDGVVDLLWLMHPTLGGECGDSFGLWAHRWVYSGWSLAPLATADPSAEGGTIRIENYTLQSGLGGEACDGGQIMAPGVTAHELGHGIGLPDLYDTGAGEASEGIGEWGLMGSGNWARPRSPAHMESWSLAQLGWIALAPVTAATTFTLRPVQTSDTAFIVRPPAGIANPRGEHFLLENRQALQSDTALIAKNKAPGLLVWHVDSAKIVQGSPGNSVNTGAVHGVWLIQADGLNQLRSSVAGVRNRGDAGDPFPGDSARTVYGPRTIPAVTLNTTGNPFAGFDVRDITQLADGAMSFQVRFGAATVVRASDTTVTVRVRGQAYYVFRYVFDDGDTATVAIDSVQSLNGGRTTATFGAWSDAQPRTHQIQASFAGDTLIAAVAVRHRLDVTATGGGTVTTAPSVPVTPSAFVDAGATVTLTATPGAGQAFIGWSGDTVAMTPVLAVPMRRPFTITANFVPMTALLAQFLAGNGGLTAAQVALLDDNGNNNGTLDIGDLLAWLDASGVQPSPSLMRRLLERITP